MAGQTPADADARSARRAHCSGCGQFAARPVASCDRCRGGRPQRVPRWVEVLAVAADGASLSTVAARIGQSRTYVAARLSEAYRELGVTRVPREHRRAEAVRVARAAGLIGTVAPSEGLSARESAAPAGSGELGVQGAPGASEGPHRASSHDGGTR